MLLVFLLFTLGTLKTTTSTERDIKIIRTPADIKYKAFGCEYKERGYILTTTPRSNWPLDNPVYSEPVSERLNFDNEDDFHTFHETLTTIASEELVRKPYDNVAPFLEMFDKFAQYNESFGQFEKFFKGYVPTYPPKGEGGITALMRVYNRLIELDERVARSFLVATIDRDVSDAFLTMCKARNKDQEPHISFQHEGLVGILQITVEGADGVLLIDMWDYKSPIPVVMMDRKHSLQTKKPLYYQYFGLQPYLEIMGDYIVILYRNVKVRGEPGRLQSVTYTTIRQDAIYIKRSLCSFVQNVMKGALLHSQRTIAKFAPGGEFEAYVSVDVGKCEAVIAQTELVDGCGIDMNDGSGTKINLKEFNALTFFDKNAIQLVENKLGLGRGILTQELKAFAEKICVENADNAKFRNDLPYWTKVFHGAPQDKSIITRGIEAFYRSMFFKN